VFKKMFEYALLMVFILSSPLVSAFDLPVTAIASANDLKQKPISYVHLMRIASSNVFMFAPPSGGRAWARHTVNMYEHEGFKFRFELEVSTYDRDKKIHTVVTRYGSWNVQKSGQLCWSFPDIIQCRNVYKDIKQDKGEFFILMRGSRNKWYKVPFMITPVTSDVAIK